MAASKKEVEARKHANLHKGDKVEWKWGAHTAEGKVQQVVKRDVTRTTKGKKITRHGTPDDPAVVIKQSDGTTVLHKQGRVKKAAKKKK